MEEEPKPSFDPEIVFPMPDLSKLKIRMEDAGETAKLLGEKRHLLSNEPKKGGMSMIALRAAPKKKP